MNVLEMRQRRAALIHELRSHNDAAETRAVDGALTTEDQAEWVRREAELGTLEASIARAVSLETREALLEQVPTLDQIRSGAGDDPLSEDATYAAAFNRYLRFGNAEISTEERTVLRAGYQELRDQSKGSNAAGGFTVPTTFGGVLWQHLVDAGVMREWATILTTTTGENIPMPKTTAHGAASWLAEAAAIVPTDETFGSVTMISNVAHRVMKVSMQLLEDNAVNLEQYIGGELGRSIGQLENTGYVAGTGTTQPTGLSTLTAAGKTGLTGQTVTILADDMLDLYYSVPAIYRNSPKCAFMANDTSIKVIRKLKDTTGQYLWQAGTIANGAPDTFNGKPVLTDPDVPVMAANAKSIIFGDLSRYLIRDVNGVTIRRLDERFADTLQVGFVGYHRTDGNLIDATGAIKHYANSAT